MISDEGKISQILRNLISNAIKFTEHGEIRVTAIGSDDGMNVIFTVSDTGIGIDARYHEAIFDEYTQIESNVSRKQKGSGLGLPISKKLAELLGGEITLQSSSGNGSIFKVSIPMNYNDRDYESVKPADADIMKHTVLVIEDDMNIVTLYEKYLKGSGFQILRANSLKKAREILNEVNPIAIFLDILLKGEEAWSFLSEIKGNENTSKIPVYVTTVLNEREKGIALGADDFATKPIEREWLMGKLKEVVRGTRPEKVLIIDDEEIARYLMRQLLADTKYQLIEASDGETGLKIAAEEHPSIILLDIVMPGIDGFETLRRLKNSSETRDIPVVVVTSKTMSEDELKMVKEKTLAYVTKGLTSREESIKKIRDAIVQMAKRKNS